MPDVEISLGHASVNASMLIGAPAGEIFRVLADPAQHEALDGSGMLRGCASNGVINRIGDTLLMKMHVASIGDYVMLNRVIEYELDRRIRWEPTPGDAATAVTAELPIGASQGYWWGFDLVSLDEDATTVTEVFDCSQAAAEIRKAVRDGERWVPSMKETLRTLEGLLAKSGDNQ
jgi:uncharacterized protein YndB with AHSA1/START domain